MYDRKLDGEVLSFGHEGVLYRDSFIMYDRKTESLWIHTTGECVKGAYKGRKLAFVPSVITSWKAWKTSHPKTLVLEGEKARGFMGTYSLDDRRERFGISVGQGEDVKLYRVADLLAKRVIQDRFGDEDIVVFFDADAMHATAWVRDEVEFSWNGTAFVDGGGRKWDVMLGQPVGAAGSDEKMRPLNATAWLIARWRGFFPGAETWEAGPVPGR